MNIIEKVSEINKDERIYGTFAEIGAGQEVAHAFFKIGHSSVTIAKTMSAYDMKFSDVIYGAGEYYVSRERLNKMLHKEYELLQSRLKDRAPSTQFFVFADTVATGSVRRKSNGHGWLGVKFQHQPLAEPSEAIIHIRFLPRPPLHQHTTVGTVGVNLLYACFRHTPKGAFVSSLKEDLDTDALEVDVIDFHGQAFVGVNNRLVVLELVKRGLSQSVMFDQNGQPQPPSMHLFRKHIVATRGSFQPLTVGKWGMMKAGLERHRNTHGLNEKEVLLIGGISMSSIHASGEFDGSDFLARVDMLAAMGICVQVADYQTDFSFVQCLNQYSTLSKALVVGTHSLAKVLDESRYHHLTGRLLEALGIMVSHNTFLYLYPVKLPGRELLTSECVFLSQNKRLLLSYMRSTGLCCELKGPGPVTEKTASEQDSSEEAPQDYISAENVRVLIENHQPWKEHVPEKVAQYITEHRLYGMAVS